MQKLPVTLYTSVNVSTWQLTNSAFTEPTMGRVRVVWLYPSNPRTGGRTQFLAGGTWCWQHIHILPPLLPLA